MLVGDVHHPLAGASSRKTPTVRISRRQPLHDVAAPRVARHLAGRRGEDEADGVRPEADGQQRVGLGGDPADLHEHGSPVGTASLSAGARPGAAAHRVTGRARHRGAPVGARGRGTPPRARPGSRRRPAAGRRPRRRMPDSATATTSSGMRGAPGAAARSWSTSKRDEVALVDPDQSRPRRRAPGRARPRRAPRPGRRARAGRPGRPGSASSSSSQGGHDQQHGVGPHEPGVAARRPRHTVKSLRSTGSPARGPGGGQVVRRAAEELPVGEHRQAGRPRRPRSRRPPRPGRGRAPGRPSTATAASPRRSRPAPGRPPRPAPRRRGGCGACTAPAPPSSTRSPAGPSGPPPGGPPRSPTDTVRTWSLPA